MHVTSLFRAHASPSRWQDQKTSDRNRDFTCAQSTEGYTCSAFQGAGAHLETCRGLQACDRAVNPHSEWKSRSASRTAASLSSHHRVICPPILSTEASLLSPKKKRRSSNLSLSNKCQQAHGHAPWAAGRVRRPGDCARHPRPRPRAAELPVLAALGAFGGVLNAPRGDGG